jgi:uncharacterized membrane protein
MKSARYIAYAALTLAVLGTMDCCTTVIGIGCLGASENNPLLSVVIDANMWAFVVLKLTATFMVSVIFVQAHKLLMKTPDKNTRIFTATNVILKAAIIGSICFLSVVVTNNFMVIASTI